MIHIYRATRYPDRDFFTFQATEDTIREFDFRFPLKIADTKKGFEGGYFVYLRDNYRETFFDLIKSYLRQNYIPPELRLSAFRAIAPLSGLWPSSIWQQKVTDAIKAAFTEQGYTVNEDEFSGSVEVAPQKPSFNRENVQVYWGVSFTAQVPEDRYPLLWCQEQFRLFMDGKPASLRQIAQAHGEGSAIMQAVRHFTTHNAEEQFNFLKRFINHIPLLASCEGITFELEPVTPKQIGLETWFWLHDSEAYFEASNGLQTILAQAMLEEGSGFYAQPDDIQVIILVPIPDSSPVIPKVEWEQVIERAEGFLAQTLPDVELPVSTVEYPVDGGLNQTIQEVEAIVQSDPDRRVLCLMATPGPEARSSTDPKLRDAEEQSFQLNKRLRDLFKGGYAATVDWDKLKETSDMPFIVNNALIGGVYRLNAQPWKLCNLPFGSGSIEATYFLGLVSDVETTIVSGVLFDHQGTLVAYGAAHPNHQDPGRRDSADEIDKLIQPLLTDGIHHSRPRPAHVIVHVSSEIATYTEDIQVVLQALSIPCDIVSVDTKSGPRLWQPANQQGTPSHGIAVGSEAQGVAYLMNTLSLAERTNRGYIYPNPNSVTVRQLAGPTSMKALAAHVYWLSVAHINALHRTVDTPVTIAYAQALYEHASKVRRSMRVTRNYRKTLFWL